jgi:hypothetical protein
LRIVGSRPGEEPAQADDFLKQFEKLGDGEGGIRTLAGGLPPRPT